VSKSRAHPHFFPAYQDLHSKLSSQGVNLPHIDFLPFPDLEQSVKDDVALIKRSKGLVDAGNVTGWVYEVETGKLREVK
jgi:carbonic anhydrase